MQVRAKCCGWWSWFSKAINFAVVIVLSFEQPASFAKTSEIESLMEEVTVTARKRDEPLLDVPISISVLEGSEIEAIKLRSLDSISNRFPNVSLDQVGTVRGLGNFSIRGLGVNSSIPSIDPTVGTIVDGVYLSSNIGTVFDLFDLGSIEVVRGPQGMLYGHNVVGGAVIINTKLPGDEFEGKARVSIEGGGEKLNNYFMSSIGGPVGDNLGLRFSVFHNDDNGYFKNLFNDMPHGKQETTALRSALTWSPSPDTKIDLRYERFKSDGDGPSTQNHRNGLNETYSNTDYDRNSFDFSVDEEGFQSTRSDFIVARIHWQVGNGSITNITGYKQLEQYGISDIDGTSQSIFHVDVGVEANQFNNEIRYNGSINDRLEIVVGLTYFNSDLGSSEGRRLLGALAPPGQFALTQDGGGIYEVESMGVFASAEYLLNESVELNIGAGYIDEKKSVSIASLVRNVNSPCSVIEEECRYDFEDDNSWKSFSPKIGVDYKFNPSALAYASWSRGYRSGGYNLRNTAIDTVNLGPGPFGRERVDALEIGIKSDQGNRSTFALALFSNQVKGIQRELNFADPVVGIVQVIKNTADVDIVGIEFETQIDVTENINFEGNVGYLSAKYKDVKFDISGDSLINQEDKSLELPRAPKLSYFLKVSSHNNLSSEWTLNSYIEYSFTDEASFTDNNLGFLNELRILNAGIEFESLDKGLRIGVFGKNMLNEVAHGGDAQLPSFLGPLALGGTFSPLVKGRVVGIDVTYEF